VKGAPQTTRPGHRETIRRDAVDVVGDALGLFLLQSRRRCRFRLLFLLVVSSFRAAAVDARSAAARLVDDFLDDER
jgi:hypothetical protein